MKMRYLGIVLAFFLLVGAVSATDSAVFSMDNLTDGDYFAKDTTLNVSGVDFTIPKGYAPMGVVAMSQSQGAFSSDAKCFVNEDFDMILCYVAKGDNVSQDVIRQTAPDDIELKNLTIKGHDGITFTTDAGPYFIYEEKDGSVVVVQAKDSNLIEKIVN